MSQEKFWVLLSKKLTGEASGEELEELQTLVAENPEWQYAIQNLGDLWKQQAPEDTMQAEDAYLLHLHRMTEMNIPFGDSFPELPRITGKKKTRKWYWAAAAAVVAIIITTAFLGVGKVFSKSSEKPSAKQENEISTRKGSKSEIKLPDGSVVWLNGGSKLTYTKEYGQQTREVTLTGEGYFDVVKMSDKPFIIHTTNINIKVLGTAFNVKAYPEDQQTETSLIRGSIEVTIKNRPKDKIILSPNEKLLVYNVQAKNNSEYSPQKEIAEKAPMVAIRQLTYQDNDSIAVETSWTSNKLSFKNELFADVAKKMERWYNVNFEFENKSKENLLMYGTFTSETLQEALEALVFSFGFRYRMENSKVIIY
ncbi:MAG: FecR family protein [Chitinophagaceae bacterium]